MSGPAPEIVPGIRQLTGRHPDWTEEEGDEDGWDPTVAWWVLRTTHGVLLVDPLVGDWPALDRLVADHGGCAGVVRTCHWHARDVAAAARRYGSRTWAASAAGMTWDDDPVPPPDCVLGSGDELSDGIRAFTIGRDDELALWLPAARALLFADAMVRDASGELSPSPESWTQPPSGRAQLLARLRELTEWCSQSVSHVLVSHGPLVLGDGAEALAGALA